VIAVGASTSICAIMGLFVANVLVLYFKGQDVKALKKRVIFMLSSLLLISLIPGVDFYGHLGSLLSGLFLGLIIISSGDNEVSKLRNVGIVCLALYTLMLTAIWI
jgi:membrane associated rhomboid family serine protease